MILDPIALRTAFGSYMTGVTVVTVMSPDSIPVGFTANSFTSVSLDPPLLLVCPAKRLSSYDLFHTCTQFAVNILADDQSAISTLFAGRTEDRFGQVNWTEDDWGSPLINGATARFSCRVHKRVDAGDHDILIGEVLSFDTNDKPGLGYASGGYFSRTLEHKAQTGVATEMEKRFVGGIICHGDQLLVTPSDTGIRLPHFRVPARTSALDTLTHAVDGTGIEIGAVYSIYTDTKADRSYTFYRGTAPTQEVGDLGHFIPLASVPASLSGPIAERTIIERYILESQSQQFGLYVGDDEYGDLHPVHPVQRGN